MLDTDRDRWERQPGESAKAFAAFAVYRDLGPTRSLAKVGRMLCEQRGGTLASIVTQLERWSSRWSWQERVEAFEIDEDRRRLAARSAAINEMEERHLALASAMSSAALARARGLKSDDGKSDVEPLDPNQLTGWIELARLSESAVRVERLTRGLPSDFSRALSHVPVAAVGRLVRDIVECTLPFIPQGEQDAALRAIEEVCRRAG